MNLKRLENLYYLLSKLNKTVRIKTVCFVTGLYYQTMEKIRIPTHVQILNLKVTKWYREEGIKFSIMMVGQLNFHMEKRKKITPTLYHSQNINSRSVVYLSMKCKTIKLLVNT